MQQLPPTSSSLMSNKVQCTADKCEQGCLLMVMLTPNDLRRQQWTTLIFVLLVAIHSRGICK